MVALNRRDFLLRALAAAPALALADLDVERLLWVPKPMVTVPSMWRVGLEDADRVITHGSWSPQMPKRVTLARFETADFVVKEALLTIENKLATMRLLQRRLFDEVHFAYTKSNIEARRDLAFRSGDRWTDANS